MADNTQLPVPSTSGDVIATDDIGGVKYQRVKLIHGAEGVNDGDVSSVNPLPMTASNVTGKFREAFEGVGLDSAKWLETKATNDITKMDGNAVAASYRVISKSPWDAGSETTLECLTTFTMPSEIAISLHLSQRTAIGQEFNIEIVDTDAPLEPIPDIAIASISQTTTTLTVNTATPHGLVVGKAIGIRDVSDTRLNFNQLVVNATPTTTQFTCTSGPNATITSATIAAINNSGFVYLRERLSRANDGTSMIFENVTATNASFYIRSNGGDALPSGTFAGSHVASISSTASVQAVNAALNYAFQPTSEYRCLLKSDYTNWQDVPVDTASLSTSRYYRRQVCPNPEKTYKLQIKAKNVKAMSRPVAGIISISKTGTTTATVTTDRPHGLTTTSYVQIYGVRDTTNFPNLVSQTIVSSVISPTQFTVIIGTASTTSSNGGYVYLVNGNQIAANGGAVAQVVQSISCTNNIVTLVGSATWSGALIGDSIQLIGITSTGGVSLGYDGAYRVRDIQTTSMFLEPIDGATYGDITSTNCGGGVIKRTDLRISYVRIFDYERLRVESQPVANGDTSASIGITINGGTAAVSTVTSVTSANLGIPAIIADVASAALTTTTTTSALTPTYGATYIVNIPVTAVSGTSPTLDFVVQESADTGTNWFDVYHFPRITATGSYNSPPLTLRGNRVRYVQTVTGTSPSFTRAVNRLQRNDDAPLRVQFIDITIVPNTLNSTSPTYYVEGCTKFNVTVRCSAQTIAATIAVQLSADGTNWFNHATTITTAVGIVQAKISDEQWKFARLIVTSAGTGITLGEAIITGVL